MENRRECPCILSVSFCGLPAYPVALFLDGSAAGEAQGDTVLTVWVESGGQAAVTAVSGAIPSDDLTVRIPYGQQAPPLYSFHSLVDCTGESARVAVRLNKHFCTLGLRFTGPPGWGSPLSVALRGSVNGISLPDEAPLPGAFCCRVDGTSARLPRQRPGDPLWLDIVLRDSVLRSFPLGTYLEEAGYDWTAPDLADRELEIDISATTVRFISAGWSTAVELDLVI